MPRGVRQRPKNLAKKLEAIRRSLDYSQSEMLKALRLEDSADRSLISAFELGKKEPNLLVLLRYARLVGISTDDLIDDKARLNAESSFRRSRRQSL
jgi:transcriptional regulator with XRE-family HTH domain